MFCAALDTLYAMNIDYSSDSYSFQKSCVIFVSSHLYGFQRVRMGLNEGETIALNPGNIHAKTSQGLQSNDGQSGAEWIRQRNNHSESHKYTQVCF